MSTREKFEAAYRAKYPETCAIFPGKFDRDEFDEYAQAVVEIAWQMWQASRAAALEEAAQIAEQYEEASGGHIAIRALAKDGGE